jgi:hypothetical protein
MANWMVSIDEKEGLDESSRLYHPRSTTRHRAWYITAAILAILFAVTVAIGISKGKSIDSSDHLWTLATGFQGLY